MQCLAPQSCSHRVGLQAHRRAVVPLPSRAVARGRVARLAPARYRDADREMLEAAKRIPPGERDVDAPSRPSKAHPRSHTHTPARRNPAPQMTGGLGDYVVDFDDEPPLVTRAKELAGRAAAKWDATTNKGEVLGLTAGIALGLLLSGAVVDAVDRLPLLPQAFKFVGTAYSAWFSWRYLLFAEGRADLGRDLRDLKASLTAKTASTYMRATEGAAPPAGAAPRERLGDLDSASNLGAAADAARRGAGAAARGGPSPKGWGAQDEE
ncbi:MAG: CAAD domains of cyanobacterial aminoacyl-tRNA synthetase-domain-containing protein [Monoraphidium minutum]|nr:MAG: CAAD domains of cyanobacterial aminoacyl-tRNA synthetase-domain-containing protein [Monoraphidium minutum]